MVSHLWRKEQKDRKFCVQVDCCINLIGSVRVNTCVMTDSVLFSFATETRGPMAERGGREIS